MARPIRFEAADFAVENGAVRADAVRISSASCGQDLKTWPLRETSVHRCPVTWARARKPSIFGSKIQSELSNDSGMRSSRIAVTESVM
jgi:hypothetical protein